ncbi:MAG: hypothetical protein ABI947_28685 [Chloroflexota bacterium]
MIWYIVHAVLTLLWDRVRLSGISPVPIRESTTTWRTVLNHYKDTLLACDFFTVKTIPQLEL